MVTLPLQTASSGLSASADDGFFPRSAITRVVLTGFMGAGKSTVGPILARQFGWQFEDVDSTIEAAQGMTIGSLFERHGEPAFRLLEQQYIASLLEREQLVLALGGGALEAEATRTLLQVTPAIHVVFLEAPLSIAIARCEADPHAALRPVLRDRERLETRFLSRLPGYRAAHQTISTADKTPHDVADAIAKALHV